MPSLCQVRADTNLVIEKFYFSILLSGTFHLRHRRFDDKKSAAGHTAEQIRRRGRSGIPLSIVINIVFINTDLQFSSILKSEYIAGIRLMLLCRLKPSRKDTCHFRRTYDIVLIRKACSAPFCVTTTDTRSVRLSSVVASGLPCIMKKASSTTATLITVGRIKCHVLFHFGSSCIF